MKYSPTLSYVVSFWFSLGSLLFLSTLHRTWNLKIMNGDSSVSVEVRDRAASPSSQSAKALILSSEEAGYASSPPTYTTSSSAAKDVLANTTSKDALFEIFGEGIAAAFMQQLTVRISRYIRSSNLSINDYEDRPANVPLDTVILHHTSLSKKFSAEQVAGFWQDNPISASGHLIVDSAGEVMLSIPIHKSAFHIRKQAVYIDPRTGELVSWINHRSIGIEFHYDPETEMPSKIQIVAGGRLLGALFEIYPDLDVRRIFGHGIQAFSQPPANRSKVSSEPTYILMQPDNKPSENMILLLQAASVVSPRIAREVEMMGGVEALAESIRSATLMNRQVTLSIDSSWSTPSNLPVSPINPALAIAEAEAIAERTSPNLEDSQ